MNLTRLELTVFVDNERAVALYKKHGFEIEGELVDYAYRNGRYVTAYTMARRKPAGV
jgi:putative acetyltransferase